VSRWGILAPRELRPHAAGKGDEIKSRAFRVY
jgi:hypothetical protein